MGIAREPIAHRGVEKFAERDDFHAFSPHAFFIDARAVGRHRAGAHSADVGVVTAGGGEEQNRLPRVVKHGGDNGNVGEVSATVIGRIHEIDVAWLQGKLFNDTFGALAHGAQMHRDVRRVRDQITLGIKYRAGKIEPLFNGEQRVPSAAGEQRVGAESGADADRIDALGWQRHGRGKTQQLADPLHRGVGVAFRVVGKQLVRKEPPVRTPRDHIGKRTATVDPELPAGFQIGRLLHRREDSTNRRVATSANGPTPLPACPTCP